VMETQQGETTAQKPGLLKRGLRMVWRVTVTGAIAAGAFFAVQYGSDELTRRADAAPTPEAAPAIPVATRALNIEDGYTLKRAFIGQVEPQKTVALSFELPGRLASIEVDEGDTVNEGDILARQDTALLEAERKQLTASMTATEAQLTLANQTVERAQELNRRGFASQAGLDDALARRDELTGRIAEIEAGLLNVDIRIGKAVVTAPFDGRVTTRTVDGGEALGAGQTILGLVELRAPVVRVGVPLDFAEAELATATVEIDGAEYKATLDTLRPDIDPTTRTRTAIFEIDVTDQPAFGQTARLLVDEKVEATGLWLPITSLKEGVRGQWTVLAVGPDNVVRDAAVEILHAETTRVFVRGAFPDGARLIDDGPQRVTVGQRVARLAGE
ncbi:MAG: efflux RND transporter periplasmic adaptor subunit, partial [Pseudomonadota bacterium]